MIIAIKANEEQKTEILKKGIKEGIEVIWLKENESLRDVKADTLMDLIFKDRNFYPALIDKPLFVNEVIATCKTLPKNCVRINAWPGFLERSSIEIAAGDETIKQETGKILLALGWQYIWAPDIPGMIAARIISMIINEAYFALSDKISTKEEIDIAMKLGTNYPYGPFEWSEKTGLKNIYNLLKKLSEQDKRYLPCTMLENEVKLRL